MNDDLEWMQRALELAEYGRGTVSPNPMVGCVIVHDNKIIGEGWHRQYGGPHAEVWAVRDVENRNNAHLLAEATAYVTLEPCSHTGKTPPCADLMITKKLQRVVVSMVDPNPLVSGRGIARLRHAGIQVTTGILADRGLELNKRFLTGVMKSRPYVVLKWAETADGFMSAENGQPVQITGEKSNMLVHKWRSEEDAILVGKLTALNDNPKLNVRHWRGIHPVRVVLDRHRVLPDTLNLFDKSQPTIIVGYGEPTDLPASPERYADHFETGRIKVQPGADEIGQLLTQLVQRGIQSVLVEGGAGVLRSFIESGYWDEIRRCQGLQMLKNGTPAPFFKGTLKGSEKIDDDLWTYYQPSL
jgi:diaminohydroxyphosphoribosylaminopyrimidine deaminase/5-amino-6-(5-phosphoribosylamino)uracil reductase